jgi:hypothetical protein
MTTVTVQNNVLDLTVNPAPPLTLTLDSEEGLELVISNGPDITLEVPNTPDVTLELEVAQGPSGVYGSSNYSVRIDQVDANIIYRGEATPGSSESMTVWRIQKIIFSGTTTSVLWAGGTNAFSYRWIDRLTLTYS